MTPDRLDELATYTTEDDTPSDARISLPWRDLRDLVALIPVVRAAMRWKATGEVWPLFDMLGAEPERDEL